MSWRPHFPYPTVRPEQEQALDYITAQFAAGNRVVVAEMGTGIGKSAIAVTLSRWLAQVEHNKALLTERTLGGVILTSQKTLQDQYIGDFSFARDLRSSSNFTCNRAGTCGETGRVRKAVGPKLGHSLSCSDCPFRKAKDDFVESTAGVTNYSYHLSEAIYAGELPSRQLLVLDEAHNIEDEVRRWTTVEIDEKDVAEFRLKFPGPGQEFTWLTGEYKDCIVAKLSKVGGKLRGLVHATGLLAGDGVKKLAGDNDRLDKRLCQINRLGNEEKTLLISRHEDRSGKRSIRFQPLDVSAIAQDVLYSRASAVLLMSATLLDKDVFLKSVGLKPTTPYISIPSPFKSEAFGMTFRPVGRMIRKDIDTTLAAIPKAIQKILALHPNDKGIIHTINYRIAEHIKENVRDPRLLHQVGPIDREKILKQHLTSKDATVLVSPSMMEGLDLRDDLGRFQIICKVPYPDMSDPVVKVKDSRWYNWRTVRTLVQAVGRGVRSADDYTKTYILDLSFMDLIERSNGMIPKHLLEGMEVEEA